MPKRKRDDDDSESEAEEEYAAVVDVVLMDSDDDDKYRGVATKKQQQQQNKKDSKKKTQSPAPAPAPDKFEQLKNKVKKQKVTQEKQESTLKDLKADATRDPRLIPFELKNIKKVDKQYRMQYQLPNSEDGKKVWYHLTSIPSLHYMSLPKLPRKKPKEFKNEHDEDRWKEEKQAFDDSKKKFMQQLRPEHLATIQAVDTKTGKTLATKDVMFDRMGNAVIWSQEMASVFVKNHPDLESKARGSDDNTVQSTFSHLTSVKTHPNTKWICHIIPQIYYAKHYASFVDTPKKPSSASTSSSSGSIKKDTRSMYLGLESNKQTFVEMMTVTGGLLENCMKQNPRAITAIRGAFTRTRSQFEAGNSQSILTDIELQWLLLGYILFNPTAQKQYGDTLAHQPERGGGKNVLTLTRTPSQTVFPGDESSSSSSSDDDSDA